jgi:hypothetical protein
MRMLRSLGFVSAGLVLLGCSSSSGSDLGLGKPTGAGGSAATTTGAGGDGTTTGAGGGAPTTGAGGATHTTSSTTSLGHGGEGLGGAGHGGAGQGGSGGGATTTTCPAGFADCDGQPGCEASLASDVQNCGKCGSVCGSANGTPSCVGGKCAIQCDAGFGDCDGIGANGCETGLSDASNCGACGAVCQGTCFNGACQAGDCDGVALAIDDADPLDAAKAIGLCAGVTSAKWVLPDGTPPPVDATQLANFHLGHGLLVGLGPNVHPQEGQHVLALSTGTARQPTDPGYAAELDKAYTSGAPPGYPKATPACGGVVTGQPHDGTSLELVLLVPPGKTGFSYAFDFYSHEWPTYVCSQFADAFLALLSPVPQGLADANLMFDAAGNYVSVDSTFIDVCACNPGPPCAAGQQGQPVNYACSLGGAQLAGTGFDGDAQDPTQHGATGWMRTQAPATPGSSLTLRLTVYDSADGVLDSTALVDDFRWLTTPGVVVGTTRVQNPK